MWVEFYCGHCGKFLHSFNESHDSIDFMVDKNDLDCYKCENGHLIKIKVRRG